MPKKSKGEVVPVHKNGHQPESDIQVTAEMNKNKSDVVSADGLGDVLIPKFGNDSNPNLPIERLSMGDLSQIDSIVRMGFPVELHADIVGIYEDIEACDKGWVDDEKLLQIQGGLSQSVGAWKDFKEISIGQQQNRNPIMGFFPNMANKVASTFRGKQEAST